MTMRICPKCGIERKDIHLCMFNLTKEEEEEFYERFREEFKSVIKSMGEWTKYLPESVNNPVTPNENIFLEEQKRYSEMEKLSNETMLSLIGKHNDTKATI